MLSYLKNIELLNENYRSSDFMNFSLQANSLYKIISATKGPTVTTIIGGYGTGKTVLINEVKKIIDSKLKKKQKSKWIFFECWQYPDKNDLWEALIIEILEQIKSKKESNKVKKQYSNIKSWKNRISDFISDTNNNLASIAGTLIFFILLTNNYFTDNSSETKRNILLILLTSVSGVIFALFLNIFKSNDKSSVSKLIDYITELERIIKEYNGDLYIVLEDVDRADTLGYRFFETVSHFIKNEKFKNKNINVLVPIAVREDGNNKQLHDSVEKVSDNILYFKPSYFCDNFIDELFTKEFLDNPNKKLLLNLSNKVIGSTVSIRRLKHIFRNAITKHERLLDKKFNSQLMICISVEFFKYIKKEVGSQTIYESKNRIDYGPFFEWATEKGFIDTSNNDPTKDLEILSAFSTTDDIFDDIRFNDIPTSIRRNRNTHVYNRRYFISDIYFDDL